MDLNFERHRYSALVQAATEFVGAVETAREQETANALVDAAINVFGPTPVGQLVEIAKQLAKGFDDEAQYLLDNALARVAA